MPVSPFSIFRRCAAVRCLSSENPKISYLRIYRAVLPVAYPASALPTVRHTPLPAPRTTSIRNHPPQAACIIRLPLVYPPIPSSETCRCPPYLVFPTTAASCRAALSGRRHIPAEGTAGTTIHNNSSMKKSGRRPCSPHGLQLPLWSALPVTIHLTQRQYPAAVSFAPAPSAGGQGHFFSAAGAPYALRLPHMAGARHFVEDLLSPHSMSCTKARRKRRGAYSGSAA